MNIVKRETVELSDNEMKAFSLVEKVLDGVLYHAENPDIQNSARMALIYLKSFKSCTEEIK